MPYKDPEQQARYYRERQERRKTDPEYIAKRKASFKNRYDNDPDFRKQYRQNQSNYRKNRRANDPEYRKRESEASRWGVRKYAYGIKFTPEQRAMFESLQACEICEQVTGKELHMDHCHDCGHYRGGLCSRCNTQEGVLRTWNAVCPIGNPMRTYLDRHACHT